MRVLLVSANRCREIVPPFPLGLACVAAAVDAGKHTVEVWDAMFEEDWQASLRSRIRTFRPDVIGLGIRNVDDQEMRSPTFFVEEAREMAGMCREESGAPLIGGGAGFSLFPFEMVSYLGLDGGVIGEGERVFPMLLDRLEAGRSPAGLTGAIWREGDQAVMTEPDWSLPLDSLPLAARSAPDAALYYEARGTAGIPNALTVQSKRGCPLLCSYCSTFAVEGRAIRVRAPEKVVEELSQLAARGFERIQFVDSVFTNPPWHARALCEELIRSGLQVRWSATVSPQYADPDLLRLMQRAGCVLVMVGNESGCSRMLRTLQKGFEPEAVERCFRACQEIGLAYNTYLLLGAPGEDRESVRESVSLLRRFDPAHVSVSPGIRLYPGCELTRQAIREGALAPDADLLTPRFYLAPALRGWIWDYLDPIIDQDPRWSY